jgi:hypothetical protein
MKKRFLNCFSGCFSFFIVVICLSCGASACNSTRHRGNVQRNTVFEDAQFYNTSIITERNTSFGEFRRLQLMLSTEGLPWVSLSRLSSDTEVNDVVGVRFRFGILSVIEYRESSIGSEGLDPTDTVLSDQPLCGPVGSVLSGLLAMQGVADDVHYNFYQCSTLMNGLASETPIVQISGGMCDLRGFVTVFNETLSPDAWKVVVDIQNYPYVANDSRLAVKVMIDSAKVPDFCPIVPAEQSDNPKLPMSQVSFGILNGTSQSNDSDRNDINGHSNGPDDDQSNSLGMSESDLYDLGYLSWETMALEFNGQVANWAYQPNEDLPQDMRLLPVIVSWPIVVGVDEDIVRNSIACELQLNTSKLGWSFDDLKRTYFYFSFPVVGASRIIWGPFAGIDEYDVDTTSAAGPLWYPVDGPFTVAILSLILSTLQRFAFFSHFLHVIPGYL